MNNLHLKDIRVELGYTMKEMASVMGVTDGAVSSWETGRTKPSPPYTEIYNQLRRRLDEYHTSKRKEQFTEQLQAIGIIGLGALLAYLFSKKE
jgi:transcriptional regulator with XRE-family HTH domain